MISFGRKQPFVFPFLDLQLHYQFGFQVSFKKHVFNFLHQC